MRISGLVGSLRSLGDTLEEVKVVRKFLRVVPAKYSQVAISIETMLDVTTMSVDELTGRLRVVEDRLEEDNNDGGSGGRLLLTEEEWHARLKGKEQGGSSSGGNGGRGRGRGRGGGRNNSGRDKASNCNGKCHNCGIWGHFARECYRPRQERREGGEEAHLAQGEDDQPAILLAQVCDEVVHDAAPEESSGRDDAPTGAALAPCCSRGDSPGATEVVNLNEERVVPVDACVWVWYDETSASNHMTRRRDGFADLDTSIGGTVKFGDGSVVEIKVRGTILFACHNGDHRALTDAYYIPRLCSNIVSLGQLDENGCRIDIGRGILRLFDRHQCLLARVPRARNRFFIVDLDIAKPACLVAVHTDDSWRWHARYGHLKFDALRKLGRLGMVRGLPCIEHVA